MCEYEPSVVTYLDILGFQSLVERRSCSELASLLDALSTHTHPSQADETVWQYGFRSFSDLVIRSFPLRNHSVGGEFTGDTIVEAIFSEIQSLIWIQISLIQQEILLRGAVTIGLLHSSHDAVFGPALNHAYLLESSVAHQPRIVVDPTVFDAIHQSDPIDIDDKQSYFTSPLREDSDGVWFVDYLKGASELDDTEGYPNFLHKHKIFIESNLRHYSQLSSLSQKVTWMAKYHNTVVGEYVGRPSKNLLAPNRSKPIRSYWFPGYRPRIDKGPVGTGDYDDAVEDSVDEEVGDWRKFLVDVSIPSVPPLREEE